ncbi:autotransporter-associated beta strand repeat-containing protein [Sphingosinicella terrae]|uniref:autotransporter-associated beta strand repeat-containing protein n=1 Tax=Sphingosinicella terrae TaxID=2172047 RepID=UPI000E0D89F0|nr:autotransporter-associated beta strand repeat-containing protein [Sphingosinicella terrae]
MVRVSRDPRGVNARTRWRPLLSGTSVSALVLLGLPSFAHAQNANRYWDANSTAPGAGGAGTWDTTSLRWSTDGIGTGGLYDRPWQNAQLDNAIFAGTAGIVNLSVPITVHNITFDSANYTLTGNTLTLAGTTPTITVNSGTSTISSVIAGTQGLTKAGAGTISLTGVNTFTGGVVVNAGGLSVDSDAALGNGANTVTLNDGASFAATGALSTSRQVVLNGAITFSGAGVGSALISGTGTLSLFRGVTMSNDANTYTGTTITNAPGTAGTVWFTSVRNTGLASSLGAGGEILLRGANIYTGDGDTTDRTFRLQPSANAAVTLANAGTGTLALTGTMSLEGGPRGISFAANSGDLDLSGTLSGTNTATVTFTGLGTARRITLGEANTYTGANSIGAVTLEVSSLADRGAASSLGTNGNTGAGLADIQIDNGVLDYTGDGDISNRTWALSNSSSVLNNGLGGLVLTGAAQFNAGATMDTLTLGGSFAGENSFSGDLTGSGRLVMNGAGTWVISGANSFTGGITVENGTLRIGSASALGVTTDVTVNGGTLDLDGYDLSLTSIAGSGGVLALGSANLTVNLGTGVDRTYSGSITGTGSFTKLGAGNLTLTGASSYTGVTTIGGGILSLDFAATSDGPTDNLISDQSALFMSGGELRVTGGPGENNSQTFDGLTITGGNNIIRATGTAANLTLDLGAITRSAGLANFVLPGAGAITTSNADGALGGWATVNGTDYAKVEGGNIVAFTSTDYVNSDDASTWAADQILSDAGGSADSAYFGTVGSNVQIGGLQYTANADSTVEIAPGATLGIDGTIIVAPSVATGTQLITDGSITGSSGGGVLGVQQNGAGIFEIASQIVDNTGTIGFTKAGAGRVVLSGSNTYTGATTIAQGTLSVNSIENGGTASAIGQSASDASNLVIQGATLEYTGGTTISDRGFTLARSGSTTSGTISVFDAAANLTFGGQVTSSDGAGLTKTGDGTLTLTNAGNDYTGITRIEAGVLATDNLANGGITSGIGAASSDSANLVLLNGSTLRYTGGNVEIDRGFTVESGAGRIDVSAGATTLTVGGVILGGGNLEKYGDGTLVLTGANLHAGTVVQEGILRAGGTDVFGSPTGAMTVNAGGILDLADNDNRIGALNGDGDVTLGSLVTTTLTIGGANSTGTGFTGTISGAGNVTHTNGTQVMAGCGNSYTGVTTITGALGGSVLATDCIRDGGEDSGIGASGSDASNLVIQNSGILNYTAVATNQVTDRGFTLAAGFGYIQVADAGTVLEFTGDFTGPGALIKRGAGTLVLSGANGSTGETRVEAGVLRSGSDEAFNNGRRLLMSNVASASFDLNGFDATFGALDGGGAIGGNITLGGATLTVANIENRTYGGTISGSGSLVKTGAGNQGLVSCGSSYTGSTTINSGTLFASCLTDGLTNSSIGASSNDASNLVLNGGALQYTGTGDSTDRQFTLGGSARINASGTGALAFTSTAAVTLTGPGARTLTLGGTNTGDNVLASQLTDTDGGGITSLTKAEAGTWRLSNADSTYTGVTSILGGVLSVDKLADGGLASSIGRSTLNAANLVIGSGSTLRYTGAGDSTNRLFTLQTGVSFIESSGTGAIAFTNTGTMGFQGNGARVFALGGTNTGANIMGVSITNGTGGATTLAKNDTGNWYLTGNSTYSGDTNINAGTLFIGNGGNTGSITSAIVNVTGFGALGFNRSDTVTYAGLIQGSGGVTQAGAGTTILTGDNLYAGGTTISAGTLQLGNGGASGAIVGDVANSGTLAFNRNNAYAFAGTITGTGTIAQIGTGTTTLTAANTAGATTISAGTLNVNGALTTQTVAMTGTSTLNVNATMGAAAGGTAIFAGDTGASTINVASGVTLRAAGDLGGGGDVVNIAGTLNTGAGAFLLGAGNDTFIVSGGLVGRIDGGAGTDGLQVDGTLFRVLDSANVTGFESLTKNDIAVLILTGDHSFANGTTVTGGTLQIGDGTATGTLAGDVANSSALRFNRAGTSTYAGVISGTGVVQHNGSGTTIFTGSNSYTGATNVNAGTLLVNGNQSGATGLVSVASGATLGGAGTTGGSVTIANGGTLAPGSNGVGALTINGNLALGDTSQLDFQFGQANVPGGLLNDIVNVGGDLTLDGTINVTESAGGNFGPGIYRIFNYGGTLNDQGLQLGAMPGGSSVQLQTSVAGQVNLVNSAGLAFSFWDGDAGPKLDGVINGGSGAWHLAGTDNNWTGADGAVNAAYADGSMAIFAGTAGTVNVDNGLGAVTASGLQFATNGYQIAGDDLTLVGSQATIRVGDGTAAGSGYTATIDAALIGDSQLVKTDAGTLILTGANSYTGGTLISGGVLSVANDSFLGDAAGVITLDGGTLQLTGASAPTTHSYALGASGGSIDVTDAAASAGILNGLSGNGGLTKLGAGSLTLAADNSYAGGTTISGGTLRIGAGGTTGSIVGDVVNNGTLNFNRSDAHSFAGSITGTGGVTIFSTGVTTLTGNSNYGGTTTLGNLSTNLRIAEGAIVTSGGATSLGRSTLTIDGANTVFSTTSVNGTASGAGSSIVSVTNGGTLRVTAGDLSMRAAGTSIQVNVSGANSLADISGGVLGTAVVNSPFSMTIGTGGTLRTAGASQIGSATSTTNPIAVAITGAGSNWTSTGSLLMTAGDFTVDQGGVATFASATFGSAPQAASLQVSGADSSFATTGDLVIGSGTGTGVLTLTDGGHVTVGGTLTLAEDAGATGILNIGGAEGAAAAASGVFDAATLGLGSATSRLNFNHTDPGYVFATVLTGTGNVNQTAGTTILTGLNTYSGLTTVDGGTLLVNGDQSSAMGQTDVASGATLGGIGRIGGDVILADGAFLAPGDVSGPGTLTINGNLSLAGTSRLLYDFGESNVVGGPLNDLVVVGGDLDLAGTIDVTVTPGGSFDVGVYRVISYGGALTGSGLAVGGAPAGSSPIVQTSVGGQVNLVNTAGLTLNFWDGEGAPGKFDGFINGGDGIWQNSAGNDNWADVTGALNGPFNDGEFAIFSAAAGTVTVDNILGPVTALGMQFVSDGYVIAGGDVALLGLQSVIRVGDGTADGLDYTATIASALTGSSQLVKTDLGTLVLTGTNSYTGGTLIDVGTLRISSDANLGDAAGGLILDGGTLNTTANIVSARSVTLTGTGTFLTDAGTSLEFTGALTGSGNLIKDGAGTLALNDTSNHSGTTSVLAGNLIVNGDLSQATGLTSVAAGSTLGGRGIIGGDVIVADGGTLAPGTSPGTLTINGGLTLGAGSNLSYEFGQANVAGGSLNDLVVVGGDLRLDGTINVSVATGGSFGPGIYRVFNYGGTLTDAGLALGTLPGGSQVSVQTSIAGQINLVNTAGLTLSFWDGDAGPKNNSLVDGGNGTWRVGGGSINWTDADGTVNADYAQETFAIFSGATGTVSIDDAGGDVLASGLQFASDAYLLTGDRLTLTGSSAIVQVGDGSAAGAGYTATIAAELAGSAALVKTDAGTLILAGTNSYGGGTTINGGTVRISADSNLGDAAGGVILDEGTLNSTADMVSARAVTLAGQGTFLIDGNTELALSGLLSGAGALVKDGAGSLVLTADNIHAGGTVIAGGTLQIGDGGTSGSIRGNVANDGALVFDRSDALTFAGAISGSGTLRQAGTGTTILTGANLYAGGTAIGSGTLQIGDGGTTGSILGDVANDGTLAFNRSDSVTFSGTVTGTGSVVKDGAGTLILSGANSYSGSTWALAGTLLVNGDQSGATGLTSVASDATLAGAGIIGGDVVVADGARLAPGAGGAGTLTINGSLSLASAAQVDMDFGAANAVGSAFNDLVDVEGDLILDGTLNVTVPPGGAFGIGLFRIANYGGTLTDNGLALGTLPAGAEVSVQTSVANQVNLINTGGATLNFWDGAAGPKLNGEVDGGDGVWQAASGNDNWADATGAVNAGYDDGAFAIFTGTAGTVTVDNSLGAVTASGLQFAADGYTIAGDALTLAAPESVIRVGDGTAGGAGYTATIASAITGTARLVKTDLGTLLLSGANSHSGGTAINGGTLRIASDVHLGAAAGGLSFDGGTLNTTADLRSARAVELAGTGTFLTDAGTTLTLGGAVTGAGSLTKSGTGTLVLAGTGSYSGATSVNAGALLVNGDYADSTGATSISSGASLGGTGTIGGDVTLAAGATLTPGAGGAGTLTIAGDLTIASDAQLDFEFGQANVAGGALNDLVNVGGDLILDGTINVTVPGGGPFEAGIYRVFNYGGALTDNGLVVGTLPGGGSATVQTSIAGQVNLVNSAGLEINFWDGGAGRRDDGVVQGGDGVWQNGDASQNWTDASGRVNAPYGNGSFAIFGGTGGTVTVDNGLGQVVAGGLQFAAGDYVIEGDALALTGPQATIRVGDGSAAGADFVATIESAISGEAQLVKTDAGTLILAGINSYGGGTLIRSGTVQISSDSNLGAAEGDITLEGGTLATSADLSSGRDLVMAGAGTISTAGGTIFTLSGSLSGSGALNKSGEGTLLLTGDSSDYGGSTDVEGTLVVNGTLCGDVNVLDGARLEGTGTVCTTVNAGTVASGNSIGTLTVDGRYTGVDGVLEVEAELGGDASAADRLVVTGGTAGTTEVVVINVGGAGAQTVEGIKIVDVTGGASDGTFALRGDYVFEGSQAVIAGAFGYRLFKGGVSTPTDGDWYLRSALLDGSGEPQGPLFQPGVPLYESYGETLRLLNGLPTLQERAGNRRWSGFTASGIGLWSRMEATRHRPDAAVSTSATDLNASTWSLQVGLDAPLLDETAGTLVAGMNVRYGQADGRVRSQFGNGTLDTQGYGIGATLTWYGSGGFYADAQAQMSWYYSDLESDLLGSLVEDNDGAGEAFSLEVGQRLPLGGSLSLTPQAQIVYSGVRFDRFSDPADAIVSSDGAESLRGRFGLSLDHQRSWQRSSGDTARTHFYGIVNLDHEMLDGTRIDVSGTPLLRREERLWGEVGIGGSFSWQDGRYALFSEISAETALSRFGESNTLRANAGFRMQF